MLNGMFAVLLDRYMFAVFHLIYTIFRQKIKVIQVQGHFKDGRYRLRYGRLVKCVMLVSS